MADVEDYNAALLQYQHHAQLAADWSAKAQEAKRKGELIQAAADRRDLCGRHKAALAVEQVRVTQYRAHEKRYRVAALAMAAVLACAVYSGVIVLCVRDNSIIVPIAASAAGIAICGGLCLRFYGGPDPWGLMGLIAAAILFLPIGLIVGTICMIRSDDCDTIRQLEGLIHEYHISPPRHRAVDPARGKLARRSPSFSLIIWNHSFSGDSKTEQTCEF
jgi:hypothetical protein